MIATSTPLALACHITVSATANAKNEQVYDWSIAKSVAPDTWYLYPGDQGTSQYTVSVTKSATTSDVCTVRGTVSLTNALGRATKDLTIEVYVQKKAPGGTFGSPSDKVTIKPPAQLPNGQTGTYSYEIQLPAGYVQPGYSYQVVVKVIDTGYNTQITKCLSIPAPVVKYDQVNVDDTNGQSWLFTGSGSQAYAKTFVAPDDAGPNVNTATIRETGESASATVTVSVLDQPTRTVQFKQADYSVDDDAGSVTLTVTMTSAAAVPVTVSYQTAPDTAHAGSDYVHVSESLTFDPGQDEKTLVVTILNDGAYSSPDEYFYAQISGVTGPAGIGTPSQAKVTITETSIPEPTVSFGQATYAAGEGDGTVTLDILLDKPADSDVVVHYRTAGVSAVDGTNFVGTSDGTVTFPAGSNADQQISVDILKDDKYSGDPQFRVELFSVSSGNAVVGSPGVAAVTIDEELPDVEFIQTIYTVGEDVGNAVLGIRLSEPSTMGVEISYGTGDGSAFSPEDYTGTRLGYTTIPGMQLEGTIVVPVIDDLENEGDERFGAGFLGMAINGASKDLSGSPMAGVTIEDNDPMARLSQSSYTVNEGDGKVTIGLLLDYGTDHAIKVHYSIMTTTSALMPDDFTDPNGGSVIIPAGQATMSFDLDIVDDSEIEGQEGFGLRLEAIEVNGAYGDDRIASPDSANVYIQDNDRALPTVQFDPVVYDIDENGGKVSLGVTLSGPASDDVVVHYATFDDTAKAGVNYTGVTDGTIMFPAGSTEDQQIEVAILDDWIYGGDTQFTVELTGVSDNAQIGQEITATVTIEEDEETYTVHLYRGWNFISSPLVVKPFMVSGLHEMNSLVTRVQKYNNDTLAYDPWMVGAPSEYDFVFYTDLGYMVYAEQETTLTFAGHSPVDRSTLLRNTWNSVGWSTFDTSDAVSLCAALSGSQRINMFDAVNQMYKPYMEGAPDEYNFGMGPGSGYLIYADPEATLYFGGIT